MAHVISVTNMKGGVGKTTLTANVGHCLSFVHSQRVLLIDVDPQFNLTQYCLDEVKYEEISRDESKGTVFDLFVPDSIAIPKVVGKGRVKKRKTFIHNIRPNLDIIPSSIKLIDFIDQRKSGSERLLSKYIATIRDNYDFILIDCPPTSTILSRAAYLSSDAYIIPMGMDYFSVMGIPLLQKDINDFKDTYGIEMKGLGIVRTKYLEWTQVAKKHKDVVEKFSNALNIKLFDSSFRQRQDIPNALSSRSFILEHNHHSEASADLNNIVKELLIQTRALLE